MILRVLVAVLSIPFVAIIAFRPVMRRLAFRNAARRPRETALVILGSLLGTAILTGSFVVGDTLEASLRRLAHTQLGPVDEIVGSDDAARAARAADKLRSFSSPDVDGILRYTVANPVAVATTGGDRRASPRSQLVEVDFGAARTFGGRPQDTGIDGTAPASGRAVVTTDLSRQIGVAAGDTIEIFAYGRSVRLVVDRLVKPWGVAGLASGFDNGSRNVFVAPGTIATLAAGRAATSPAAPRALIAISNRGDVETGAALTSRVTGQLLQAIGEPGVTVRTAKKDVLQQAKDSGAMFSQLFSAMGTFGVVAGILLLVNIFVMLAEERRSELGMLRAVGMRRATLVGAFSTEGWLYSLAAAATGTIFGLGLGRVIGAAAAGIFSGGVQDFRVDLTFAAKASSIERGFGLGFTIAIITVILTSVRISRFNVIHAIRDLTEAPGRRLHARTLVLGAFGIVLGGLWTASSFRNDQPMGKLLAPVLVVVGFVPLLDRLLPRRVVQSAAGLIAVAWGVLGIRFLFRQAGGGDNNGINMFVAQGILLTAASVALVTQNQDAIGAVIRRVGGGTRRLALRLGLAYPLARKFRTGMTLAMYTLVMFTLTFITQFSFIVQRQVDDFAKGAAGGYDVLLLANATNPVTPEQVASRPGVTGVAPLWSTFAEIDIPGHDTQGAGLSAFDARFVDLGAPSLERRDKKYASDADAYRAVLADPGLAIVNPFIGQRRRGGPPRFLVDIGGTVKLTNPSTLVSRDVTVAAYSGNGGLQSGVLYGEPGARSMFGDRLVANPIYVTAKGDPARVASELTGAFLANGVEARAIQSLVTEARGQELQFFGLIRGYLALGLLVGIAGLGVIMVRAVRERRRQIGVLRAIGIDASTVRRAFMIESGFVALEGVLIGVILALITSYTLVTSSDVFGQTLRWGVPVGSLAALIFGTLAVSLLATAAPSQAASRIRPAVALRIAD